MASQTATVSQSRKHPTRRELANENCYGFQTADLSGDITEQGSKGGVGQGEQREGGKDRGGDRDRRKHENTLCICAFSLSGHLSIELRQEARIT